MNAERRAFAAALYASGREHDATQPDRLARWRNVEPETAELLGVLVRGCDARRVLEIGTSNGYSTLWLADAAESIGGTVTSLEIEPARTALAAQHLAHVGLAAVVDLRIEDAAPHSRPSTMRPGTSSSSTPSGRRMSATGRTSCASLPVRACSRSTT